MIMKILNTAFGDPSHLYGGVDENTLKISNFIY